MESRDILGLLGRQEARQFRRTLPLALWPQTEHLWHAIALIASIPPPTTRGERTRLFKLLRIFTEFLRGVPETEPTETVDVLDHATGHRRHSHDRDLRHHGTRQPPRSSNPTRLP